MSFEYRGKTVTRDNFKEFFSQYSRDTLDEIELAVLHGANIGEYIRDCRDDFDKLREIRKAVEDGVDKRYISTLISSKTMYTIRQGVARGRNMSLLLDYYTATTCRISTDLLDRLAEAVYNGVNISKVDFTRLPVELFDSVIHGLSKGYPMWLILESDVALTPKYVSVLMKALQLGIDIQPFLSEIWDERVLMLLFSNSRNVNISSVVSIITSRFDYDFVQCIIDAVVEGFDVKRVCVHDNAGYPAFNSYQADILIDAIKKGYPYDDIFNTTLSDIAMHDKVVAWESSKVSV